MMFGYVTGDAFTNFYRNVLKLSSINDMKFTNCSIWLAAMATKSLQIEGKISESSTIELQWLEH